MLEGMMMNFFNVPMNVRKHCNRQVCCTDCCTMIKKNSLTYQKFSVNGYMNVAVKYQRIINERSLFIEVILPLSKKNERYFFLDVQTFVL